MGFTRMLHGTTFSCPGSAKWLYRLIDGWLYCLMARWFDGWKLLDGCFPECGHSAFIWAPDFLKT
jgi:hypothetical protein